MNKQNYDRIMQQQIEALPAGTRPRLLLHSCCGPCSSAVIERLAPHFALTVYFYNPNIGPKEEYRRRLETQRRLLTRLPGAPVPLIEGPYEPDAFYACSRDLEHEPEGGARCTACYRLRLSRTAALARSEGYDFFTTTLSVSPHKDAERLNCLGAALDSADARYLYADFKKRGGYQRSLSLSADHGLYRQRYCGCPFAAR